MTGRLSGYGSLGMAAVTWGSLPVVVRRAGADPAVLVCMRMGFGALALLIGLFAFRRREFVPSGHMPVVVALGATLAASWYAFFRSISLLPGATAVLINYVFPLFVAVLAPVLIGERRERHAIPLAAVGFAGVALILSPEAGAGRLEGVVFGLFAASTSVGLVMVGRYAALRVPGPLIALWQNLIGFVLLLIPALAAPAPPLRAWAWGALIGCVHTAATGVLFFRALARVPAQEAGVLMYIEPVSAVVFAALFLGARPAATALAGGALVIGAGLVLVLAPSRWRGTDRTSAAPGPDGLRDVAG